MNNKTEWLLRRKQGIGGSDCAAVLGKSPWGTPLKIYNDKISPEVKEIQSEAMYWGKVHEPEIIKKYGIVTGKKCITDNEMITSVKYPWLFANVDALIKDEPLVLEAKSTGFFGDKWGADGSDEIPDQYLIQCAHYCLVMSEFVKIEGADLAALGSTNDFRIYHYERNKKLEELIINVTHDFWHKYVMTKESPPLSDLDKAKDVYKDVLENGVVVADNEIFEAYQKALDLRDKIKIDGTFFESLKEKLQRYLKENETLIDIAGNKLNTWKRQFRKIVDVERLKIERPEIYNEFLRTSKSRVFNFKVIK